jgi:predicted secreted protein
MKMTFRWRRALVYDIHFIRALCDDMAHEKDPKKTEQLLALLQAVVKDDQEEVRVRMKFLARRYAHFLTSESKAAD